MKKSFLRFFVSIGLKLSVGLKLNNFPRGWDENAAYYIVDLYWNNYTAYQTKEEVCQAWVKLCGGEEFWELNVTGKDTYTLVNEYNGTVDTYLRRYIVLDSDGRSIDIRDWVPFKFPPKKRRAPFCLARSPRRIYQNPRLYHRALVEESIVRETEKEEDMPVDFRYRTKKMDYECVEDSSPKRSWKKTCKRKHQWAKRIRRPNSFPAAFPEDGFELAARLSAELVKP